MSGGRLSGGGDRLAAGVDGYNLALPQGTGVATYGRGLVRALARLGFETEGLYGLPVSGRDPLAAEVALFDAPVDRRRPFVKTKVALRTAGAMIRGEAAWPVALTGRVTPEPGRLPAFDRLWNVERLFAFAHTYFDLTGRRLRITTPRPPAVMHWTYPLPIEWVGAKNLYTLHDLVPLRLPHTTLDNKPRYLRLMRMLARDADHLVTVSEASKRDIIALLGVDPERVTNTYQSVEGGLAAAAPPMDEARALVRAALGLEPRGYHLFFGAIEPKKNVGRLLEAFLAADLDRPLVLVGKAAWKSDDELRLLGSPAAQGFLAGAYGGRADGRARVLHLGHAPQPLLASLVRDARSVIFPSLSEGFGLPVLEAMSLGAPVITSTAGSLPEVAGDAALAVEPYDVGALTAAIRKLDGDAVLQADLAARGPLQAQRFSAAAYDARLAALHAKLGLGA